jgi:hypothetical protein
MHIRRGGIDKYRIVNKKFEDLAVAKLRKRTLRVTGAACLTKGVYPAVNRGQIK